MAKDTLAENLIFGFDSFIFLVLDNFQSHFKQDFHNFY